MSDVPDTPDALGGPNADIGSADGPGAPGTPEGPAGEVETDEMVFERLYAGLRRFAAVVAPPEQDPDDLVQEAVSRVLRRRSLSSLENPGAYLRRSIVNLASNERRRLGRWRRARVRAARPPADDAQPAAYPSDLDDLLRLPPDTRAALWLVDVEGRGFDEVAELLGCSRDAAKARASRARRALRQSITEEEER
jgi:RNA polymerase sigma-70 factor (ECF subfamily)